MLSMCCTTWMASVRVVQLFRCTHVKDLKSKCLEFVNAFLKPLVCMSVRMLSLATVTELKVAVGPEIPC